MTDTPHLALPVIDPLSQKHLIANDAFAKLDALVMLAVLDRDLAAPPGAPADGDRYLVKTPGSGLFAGHDNEIAHFSAGDWSFYTPRAGWLCFVRDEGLLLLWNGSAWVGAASAIELQNLARLGVGTTADATNPLAAKLNSALFAAKTVAEGGDGNLRYVLSKEASAKTLSFLFQDNYSGCAEIGLAGDDDFHFKVSADGTNWRDGLTIARATGNVAVASTTASTSSATGALTVAGGLGVGGAINAGGDGTFGGTARLSSARVSIAGGALNGIGMTVATALSGVIMNNPSPGQYNAMVFGQNSVQVGNIVAGVSSTAYNTSSDERLKFAFGESGTDWGAVIDAVPIVDFRFRSEPDKVVLGTVAQWIAPVFPQGVSRPGDDSTPWGFDYSQLAPLALWGVKDLRARLAAIEARLDAIEQRLAG